MLPVSEQILDINKAHLRLKNVVIRTPVQLHRKLSERFGAEIYLKR
jgi:threonine dehydratase